MASEKTPLLSDQGDSTPPHYGESSGGKKFCFLV